VSKQVEIIVVLGINLNMVIFFLFFFGKIIVHVIQTKVIWTDKVAAVVPRVETKGKKSSSHGSTE